jgi:hypothetical protein
MPLGPILASFFAAAALLFAGCQAMHFDGQPSEETDFDGTDNVICKSSFQQIKKGMTEAEVEALLTRPADIRMVNFTTNGITLNDAWFGDCCTIMVYFDVENARSWKGGVSVCGRAVTTALYDPHKVEAWPYAGTKQVLPGTICAENFDRLTVGMTERAAKSLLGPKVCSESHITVGVTLSLLSWCHDNNLVDIHTTFWGSSGLGVATYRDTSTEPPFEIVLSEGGGGGLQIQCADGKSSIFDPGFGMHPVSASEPINEVNFNKLRAGMTESQVNAILGRQADKTRENGSIIDHDSQWFGGATTIVVSFQKDSSGSSKNAGPATVKQVKYYTKNMRLIWWPESDFDSRRATLLAPLAYHSS